MNIQPLGSRVVVKPEEEAAQQINGIYIPDSAQEKPQTGEVVAIGTSDDITVKVGDTVMMPKYGGMEVKIEGTVYQILRQDDILGVLS